MAHHNHADYDLFIGWLRDAYAMEKGQVRVLENHAKDAKRHPEIQARLEQHADETRNQARRLEECLRQFGEEPSTLKNTLTQAVGTVQGMASGAFRDDEVKNALLDYASEHFEIACYKALIHGARTIGRDEVARVCEEILREEETMARFLEQQLPTIVRDELTATGVR
jgi:ferritin-like metal-binding protein YciE